MSGESASFSHLDRSVFAEEDRLYELFVTILCLFKRSPT